MPPTIKKPKENQCFLALGLHPSPPGCAGQARNPVRPNVGHFFHQMGRHPTILDIRGGVLHRIPLRISPDRSNPLNLNFFLTIFWTKNQKKSFSGRKKTPLRGTLQLPWRAWRQIQPIGAQGGPCGAFWGQFRPIWGPGGPCGALGGHFRPKRAQGPYGAMGPPWAPGPI